MKLNVSAELKQPGRVSQHTLSESVPPLEYLGRQVEFESPITVRAEVSFDGEGFSVKGELETVLRSECARCTKLFPEPVSVAFEERFVKARENEESEAYLYEGETLDFSELIRDNLLLNLPISSVCSENCKGLCPVCGCDLNTAQCSCVIEDEPPKGALSKLEQLLNENKEV